MTALVEGMADFNVIKAIRPEDIGMTTIAKVEAAPLGHIN